MKRLSIMGVLLLFILSGTNAGAAVNNDWLCIPGVRVGPITSKSSEADLKKLFGAKNVKRETILVAEGTEELTVSYIYKGGKDEACVWWSDTKKFRNCSSVHIYNEGGRWHTKDGIRIGAPLDLIRRINGKPFKFYGFGWDYGGIVYDWGKGKLEKSRLDLRFNCKETAERAMKYMGDGVDIQSDDPGLKGLEVKVGEMVIMLK